MGWLCGVALRGSVVGESTKHLDRMIPALDKLAAADSFVHPHRGIWSMVTNKLAARGAIWELDATISEIIEAREREGLDPNDLSARICASWDDIEGGAREIGIARDIVVIHMGLMSNLFAAPAWTLVHLLERPEIQERPRIDSERLDRATYESIRLTVQRLLEQYRFTRKCSDPQLLRRQLGGVARADRPCRVIYRLR